MYRHSSSQCTLPHHYRNSHAIWDHSVTCHPAEVTFLPLPQPKLVLDLATPEGCKAELSCVNMLPADQSMVTWQTAGLADFCLECARTTGRALRLSFVTVRAYSMQQCTAHIVTLCKILYTHFTPPDFMQ